MGLVNCARKTFFFFVQQGKADAAVGREGGVRDRTCRGERDWYIRGSVSVLDLSCISNADLGFSKRWQGRSTQTQNGEAI